MKLFIFSFLCAINLPSLSLGFKCYTCSESGSGIGRCAENKKPELKECQVGSGFVPHCYLEEYLENRKPFSMGCYGVHIPAKSSSCHTTNTTTPQEGKRLGEIFLSCTCVTDSCNTYENGTKCYSCDGNVGKSTFPDYPRTDYICKNGETPFNETQCPLSEQYGCMIKWEKKHTIIGCMSNTVPIGKFSDCDGNKDSGKCYCSANFCNTEDMKEQYRAKQKPEPDPIYLRPHYPHPGPLFETTDPASGDDNDDRGGWGALAGFVIIFWVMAICCFCACAGACAYAFFQFFR